MDVLFVLLERLLLSLKLGQAASDGARLLLSEVGGDVFLAGVENAQLFATRVRDDRQDTRNVLANVATGY